MSPLLAALVESGVLSLADAERIDRQLDPEAARDYAERLAIDAFHAGLTQQQRRILDVVDEAKGRPTDSQLARLWEGEDELLWLSVRDPLLDIASERATAAAVLAGNLDTWNLVNESVLAWVDGYYTSSEDAAFGSIPNLNLTSRQHFSEAFMRWQRGEVPVLGRPGLPGLIELLQPTFGATRAELISSTEVTRIFTESLRVAEAGNPYTTQWEWLTAADEIAAGCPICGPRNGMRIAKSEDGFSLETDGLTTFPPAHPRCRCQVIALTDESARVNSQ